MPGLLLVRHAQSTWNVESRWQGQADPPLSETGEEQARAAGVRVTAGWSIDAVFSSDLTRARRTAELMAESIDPPPTFVLEPGLREYDVGAWSGLSRDQIEERWPGVLARFDAGQVVAPPGGEDRSAFDARVQAAGMAVASTAARLGAARILVVAHGGVVRSLARAARRPERGVAFLAGYWGEHSVTGGLQLIEPVDLLDRDDPRDCHPPEIPSPL